MKKRRVITRSGARVRGYFNSMKSGRLIPYESDNERTALMWLELNSTIASFDEHQSEILVQTQEGSFAAYPDFNVTGQDGETAILEVKPEAEQIKLNTSLRLAAIREHFEREGIKYSVVCGVALARPIGYETLRLLHQLRRPSIRRELIVWQPKLAKLCRLERTLGQVSDAFGSWPLVLNLLANDFLIVDLSRSLTQDLPARIYGGSRP
jgi:hypothetical protein